MDARRDIHLLTLLVRHLARRDVATAPVMAKHLELPAPDVYRALDSNPAIFRRRAEGPNSFGIRSIVSRVLGFGTARPAASPTAQYRLQLSRSRTQASGPSKEEAPEPGRYDAAEVEALIGSLERTIESHRAAARLRAPAWILAAAVLFVALLSGGGESLRGALAGTSGRPGAVRLSCPACSPAPVQVSCTACPAPGPTAGGDETPPSDQGPSQPGPDSAPASGSQWLGLAAILLPLGLGAALLLRGAISGEGAQKAPVLTLGTALTIIGGLATWAKPALVPAKAASLHDAVGALLLACVLTAAAMLVAGYFFRGFDDWRKWLRRLPLPAAVLGLVALALATESSRHAFVRDYLEPYLAAPGPERFYHGTLAALGLLGLGLAAGLARWLSRWPRTGE